MPYPLTKRILDLALSALGLLIFSPVGLLIAVLIKLSDGGPVFYGQSRVGQFGIPFRIWKFRSMIVNAEKLGAPVTMDGDPRITRLGRFLRKTKLDELPQLWNVLTGDMSLVGPRPELPKYVAQYSPAQRDILRFKPGITDLASLLFRNEEDLLRGAADLETFYMRYCVPKKLELNQAYAKRAGALQDLFLILRTFINLFLSFLLLCGARTALRFGRQQLWAGGVPARPKRRTAIIGVNESAINLLLDSRRSPRSTRHVVAFFDDDPRTWGKRPRRVPVVGMPECLLHQPWPDQLDEIIITLPQAQAARVTELCNLLKSLPLTVTVAASSSAAPLAA